MQPNQKQFALDISQTPKPSLRNFITPKNSTKDQFGLLDALKKISSHWANQTRIPSELLWIYCWGPEGCGKTHLVLAMLSEALALKLTNLHLKPGDQKAWQNLSQLIETQLLPRAIFIEDIERLNADEQNTLFRLQIEARENPDLFLFCTGSTSVAGLKIRDDIQSRLSWGLNFELPVLTDEQKIQAIHLAAKERGISLSNDVPAWLLNHFHRDLPSLLSLIEALDHFSLEKKRAVTLPLLREFLQSTPN
jgi:DnaA family protein